MTATDSLVSSHVYEIVKTIYSSHATDTSEEARMAVIQNTLGQLRLANIATLDAITTHFTRLIELTSADEAYITALTQTLAPCILRPRQESQVSMNERFSYRLLRDLFAHKEEIFGELKRASSLTHSASGSKQPRPRAISTDESNRRAAMEERQRAITDRTRDKSPAPADRSHRRDKSMEPPKSARFPINVNPSSVASPTTAERRKSPPMSGTPIMSATSGPLRNSLEVPGSLESSPVAEVKTNGSSSVPSSATSVGSMPQASAGAEAASVAATDGVAKRDSLGRSAPGSRFPRKPAGGLQRQSLVNDKRDSIGSEDQDRPRGVTLEDRPMDD